MNDFGFAFALNALSFMRVMLSLNSSKLLLDASASDQMELNCESALTHSSGALLMAVDSSKLKLDASASDQN